MSPKQVLNAMSLAGYQFIDISHGEQPEHWGIRLADEVEAKRVENPGDQPPLIEYGDEASRISKKFPVFVEVRDPLEREGPHHVAALRRLRNYMTKQKFDEREVIQEPFYFKATFAGKSAAAKHVRPASKASKLLLPKLTLTDSGPQIDEERLAALEAKFEIRLPDAYRAFLLQHNGGKPEAHAFSYIADGETEEAELERLLSIDVASGGDFDRDDLSATIEFHWGSLDLPEDYIPIGYTDIHIICLSIRGQDPDRVFLWDLNSSGFEPEDMMPLNLSFVEFLSQFGNNDHQA